MSSQSFLSRRPDRRRSDFSSPFFFGSAKNFRDASRELQRVAYDNNNYHVMVIPSPFRFFSCTDDARSRVNVNATFLPVPLERCLSAVLCNLCYFPTPNRGGNRFYYAEFTLVAQHRLLHILCLCDIER